MHFQSHKLRVSTAVKATTSHIKSFYQSLLSNILLVKNDMCPYVVFVVPRPEVSMYFNYFIRLCLIILVIDKVKHYNSRQATSIISPTLLCLEKILQQAIVFEFEV